MKNLETTSAKKLRNFSLASFLIVFLLFLSACQKEELASTNSSVQANNENLARQKQPADQSPFTLITIDHSAAQTHLPDYSVTIRSDGNILFNGRRNTAVSGKVEFKAPQKVMTQLRVMFTEANLSDMENLPSVPDLPSIATTFKAATNAEAITRIDFNHNNPRELIQLRTKTETLLKISTLVIKPRNLNDIQDRISTGVN